VYSSNARTGDARLSARQPGAKRSWWGQLRRRVGLHVRARAREGAALMSARGAREGFRVKNADVVSCTARVRVPNWSRSMVSDAIGVRLTQLYEPEGLTSTVRRWANLDEGTHVRYQLPASGRLRLDALLRAVHRVIMSSFTSWLTSCAVTTSARRQSAGYCSSSSAARGSLIYLVVRGGSMHERQMHAVAAQQKRSRLLRKVANSKE